MLKDKNFFKAMEIFSEREVNVDMTLEEMAMLQLEVEIAQRAYNDQANAVKKHHKEVYSPMCTEKEKLEIEMYLKQLELDAVKKSNPEFAKLVKLAANAVKKGRKIS